MGVIGPGLDATVDLGSRELLGGLDPDLVHRGHTTTTQRGGGEARPGRQPTASGQEEIRRRRRRGHLRQTEVGPPSLHLAQQPVGRLSPRGVPVHEALVPIDAALQALLSQREDLVHDLLGEVRDLREEPRVGVHLLVQQPVVVQGLGHGRVLEGVTSRRPVAIAGAHSTIDSLTDGGSLFALQLRHRAEELGLQLGHLSLQGLVREVHARLRVPIRQEIVHHRRLRGRSHRHGPVVVIVTTGSLHPPEAALGLLLDPIDHLAPLLRVAQEAGRQDRARDEAVLVVAAPELVAQTEPEITVVRTEAVHVDVHLQLVEAVVQAEAVAQAEAGLSHLTQRGAELRTRLANPARTKPEAVAQVEAGLSHLTQRGAELRTRLANPARAKPEALTQASAELRADGSPKATVPSIRRRHALSLVR